MKSRVFVNVSILIVLIVLFTSCSKRVEDADGNIYKTVKIGDQEWMAENLAVSHFQNGDSLFHVKSKAEWEIVRRKRIPAWSYYDYDPINSKTKGKLYNWYAISDPRGLAPKGWHIASFEEWKSISNEDDKSYEEIKKNCGLSKGSIGYWWTSTEDKVSSGSAYYFFVDELNDLHFNFSSKHYGLSVRCIKNDSSNQDKSSNNKETNEMPTKKVQPSPQTILDLNLRDLSGMKNILGSPFYDDGDVVGWKYDDFEIEYQSSYPAIIVKLKNNINDTKTEFSKYLSLNTYKAYMYYRSKIVRIYSDRIQIQYKEK